MLCSAFDFAAVLRAGYLMSRRSSQSDSRKEQTMPSVSLTTMLCDNRIGDFLVWRRSNSTFSVNTVEQICVNFHGLFASFFINDSASAHTSVQWKLPQRFVKVNT